MVTHRQSAPYDIPDVKAHLVLTAAKQLDEFPDSVPKFAKRLSAVERLLVALHKARQAGIPCAKCNICLLKELTGLNLALSLFEAKPLRVRRALVEFLIQAIAIVPDSEPLDEPLQVSYGCDAEPYRSH